MRDYREVRAALRQLQEAAEVSAHVEHFLSRLTPAEARVLPAHVRRTRFSTKGMEALAEAALDLKREELRHRTGSEEMITLEMVAGVFATAAARLAEISAPTSLRSMIPPNERGVAERRIARRPDL
jgi:hypothetical protein